MALTSLGLLLLLSPLLYGQAEGKPEAVLKLDPDRSLIFTGETVTLSCEMKEGHVSDWKYTWRQNDRDIVTDSGKSSYIISSVQLHLGGDYRCVGRRLRDSQYSEWSSSVTLKVQALPTATVKRVSPQGAINPRDTVILLCDIPDHMDWSYTWFKNKQSLTNENQKTITLHPDAASLYSCEGSRRDRPTKSQLSDNHSVTITARPYAVWTLQPNWTQIYIGETVTIKCEIKGTDDFKGWEYSWYKGNNLVGTIESQYKFNPTNIERVEFTCKGDRDSVHSEFSEPLRLTVSGKPQPILSVSPSWLNPGDSVTLTCEVEVSSTDWRFYWYRAVPYQAELPSLAHQSYSVEPLLDSAHGIRESSYILHGATHTAGYVCRAGRGRPVYHSYYSKAQFLWSGDQHPSASLTVNTSRSQHFTSESVSLSCEGTSIGWKVKRNTTDGVSDCSSNWGSMTGHICSLGTLYTGLSGVYWCESGSGEYSNAVNITLTYQNVILESPVHPVTEGDSVTLRCKHRNLSPNSKADFYKDGGLIQNGTSGEMTIPAVSKSHEGLYRCRYSDGEESPESWLIVRGSSSSGLVVGLVVTGILLALLLILILLLCKKYNGPCFGKTSRSMSSRETNQSQGLDLGANQNPTSDDHQYSALKKSSNDVYETIQVPVINPQERRADPAEDTDYSDIRPTAAPGEAAENQHLNFSLLQFKKEKSKTGKKSSTPAPADCVYAEVMPGSTLGSSQR